MLSECCLVVCVCVYICIHVMPCTRAYVCGYFCTRSTTLLSVDSHAGGADMLIKALLACSSSFFSFFLKKKKQTCVMDPPPLGCGPDTQPRRNPTVLRQGVCVIAAFGIVCRSTRHAGGMPCEELSFPVTWSPNSSPLSSDDGCTHFDGRS